MFLICLRSAKTTNIVISTKIILHFLQSAISYSKG